MAWPSQDCLEVEWGGAFRDLNLDLVILKCGLSQNIFFVYGKVHFRRDMKTPCSANSN